MDDKIHSFSLLGREKERERELIIYPYGETEELHGLHCTSKLKKKVNVFLIFQP
jgi:hypothetical protein